MISYVRACDGGDVRTADYTIPGGCASSLDYDSPHDFFMDAVKGTCTGNFRVELNRKNTEYSDTLPVAIDRQYLLPGCLYYLDGHVLILATIDKYGEPLTIVCGAPNVRTGLKVCLAKIGASLPGEIGRAHV